MRIEFQLKSGKPIDVDDLSEQIASIYHRDEKMLDFEMTAHNICDIPVFIESTYGKISHDMFASMDCCCNTKEIQAILVCSYDDFLDILKWRNGADVETCITESRGLILYFKIGENNNVLLMSYGISDK